MERLALRYSAGHIQSRLATEAMQLFVAEADGRVVAACVTQVNDYPTGARVLDIIGIGGQGFGLWQAWFEDLKNCARLMNCQYISASAGRDGWARVMQDTGLEKLGTLYQMEVQGHA